MDEVAMFANQCDLKCGYWWMDVLVDGCIWWMGVLVDRCIGGWVYLVAGHNGEWVYCWMGRLTVQCMDECLQWI